MALEQSGYAKFLPPEDMPAFHAPFWASVNEHAVAIQRCDGCGKFRYIPTEICSACGLEEATWVPIDGRGVIYTYTVVHRAPTPAYQLDAPYVIAHVTLPEGPRMISNLVTDDVDGVHIGMAVRIIYEDVDASHTLFKFAPEQTR